MPSPLENLCSCGFNIYANIASATESGQDRPKRDPIQFQQLGAPGFEETVEVTLKCSPVKWPPTQEITWNRWSKELADLVCLYQESLRAPESLHKYEPKQKVLR